MVLERLSWRVNSPNHASFLLLTVSVRQGCLLSPILFNLFLEIMQETLHDHQTSMSIGGRHICNLRFADDIDLMGGSNGELQDLTSRLIDRATAYGTEVSTEKSKIMTNGTNNISVDISIRPEVREGDQFEVHASNPVKRLSLLSIILHQDCLRNDSNGQTKQDLAVQHHQLRREVQSLQVSCHPRSSSMAVKHGPCFLTMKNGSGLSKPNA